MSTLWPGSTRCTTRSSATQDSVADVREATPAAVSCPEKTAYAACPGRLRAQAAGSGQPNPLAHAREPVPAWPEPYRLMVPSPCEPVTRLADAGAAAALERASLPDAPDLGAAAGSRRCDDAVRVNQMQAAGAHAGRKASVAPAANGSTDRWNRPAPCRSPTGAARPARRPPSPAALGAEPRTAGARARLSGPPWHTTTAGQTAVATPVDAAQMSVPEMPPAREPAGREPSFFGHRRCESGW